jgi:hypothetical protein
MAVDHVLACGSGFHGPIESNRRASIETRLTRKHCAAFASSRM